MIRTLIVDDQRTARNIMELTIQKSDRYTIVKSIIDAGNAYLYCMKGDIDLILMDVYTIDGENGIDAAKKIKQDFPHIKIIIVTSMPEESFIRKAKDAGCESFFYKDFSEEDLLVVMDKTMEGESIYPDFMPDIKIGSSRTSELTKREIEVLRYMVNGYSQKETAVELGIKYDSVRSHIKNILSKTGYDSPSRLIAEVSHKNFMIPGFFANNKNE